MSKSTINQELSSFKESDYDLSFIKDPRRQEEMSDLDYLAIGVLSSFIVMGIFWLFIISVG
jgi:hypothetical protein